MTSVAAGTLGFLACLILLMLLYITYQVYTRGNEWAQAKVRKVWYRIWFKLIEQDCATCQGTGVHEFGGGVVGQTGTLPALSLPWECGYCGGTGKESIVYTYRFSWLYGRVLDAPTPIEYERDQQAAEDVLGPARERWLTTKGVRTGGDDDSRTDDG